MKRTLQLRISAGEATCASEPGKFCPFVGVTNMGTVYVCRLFPSDEAAHSLLIEKDGWLQRLPKCVLAEQEATND